MSQGWFEKKNPLTGKAPVHQEVASKKNKKELSSMSKAKITPIIRVSEKTIKNAIKSISDAIENYEYEDRMAFAEIRQMAVELVERKRGKEFYDDDEAINDPEVIKYTNHIMSMALVRLAGEYAKD